MAWYEEWFGEEYISLYPHRDNREALDFINTIESKIKFEPDSRLLDLCCGAGRYCIELAKKGYHLTGIDLSEELIDYAKKHSKEIGLDIVYHVGDMRHIPYREHFDAVFNMFTSFGYFESDADNEKVIQSIADSLKNNGCIVLDFMNKKHILDSLIDQDERNENNLRIIQNRRFDKSSNRIEKTITLCKDGYKKQFLESVRLYTVEELTEFFSSNRLELIDILGDYRGEPFSENSPRAILIGRKISCDR